MNKLILPVDSEMAHELRHFERVVHQDVIDQHLTTEFMEHFGSILVYSATHGDLPRSLEAVDSVITNLISDSIHKFEHYISAMCHITEAFHRRYQAEWSSVLDQIRELRSTRYNTPDLMYHVEFERNYLRLIVSQ